MGDGAVDRDRDEEKRRSQDPETWQVGRFARDKPGELSCRALAEMTSAIQTALGYPKAISAWFDQRRGLALGIAMSGVGLGGFVIPQLANVLIERVGWRGAYVYLALMTLAIAFPAVALWIREPRPGEGERNAAVAAIGQWAVDRVGDATGLATRCVRAYRARRPRGSTRPMHRGDTVSRRE